MITILTGSRAGENPQPLPCKDVEPAMQVSIFVSSLVAKASACTTSRLSGVEPVMPIAVAQYCEESLGQQQPWKSYTHMPFTPEEPPKP